MEPPGSRLPLHNLGHPVQNVASGRADRAICSSLIAQAFQSVRYPILPRYGAELPVPGQVADPHAQPLEGDILRIRHSTHFVPRDFDLSPYFAVIKPTLEQEFDYRDLQWKDLQCRAMRP